MGMASSQDGSASTSYPSVLSSDQVKQFYDDGYLTIPDFFSQETCKQLLDRSKTLLKDFDVSDHPMSQFKTGDADHVGDDYFIDSGDKIRFFFEPDAFDTSGKLTKPKERSINKIGHGLHERDPAFRDFTLANQRLKTLAKELAYHKDPKVLRSMIICKQPEIGGEVPSHDDSTFLYTDPPSALGFWFALEDCTTSNGCLSFLPGSHKLNKPIAKRFVRRDPSGVGGCAFETLVPAETLDEETKPGGKRDWKGSRYAEDWRVGECKAGTLVLIDGAVIHASERNKSQKSRFIYTFHMIEGQARYDDKNWLQPTPDHKVSNTTSTSARLAFLLEDTFSAGLDFFFDPVLDALFFVIFPLEGPLGSGFLFPFPFSFNFSGG